MEISRRNFFKLGTIFGLGSVLPSCTKELALKPKEEPLPPKGEEKYVRSVCGMCSAGCGLRVRLVDGRPVGLSGILDHPINQGGLCPKGAAGLQELYHPDRIRNPLIRKGGHRTGNWISVSWEEAMQHVSEKIKQAKTDKKSSLSVLTGAEEKDIHQEVLRELVSSTGKDNLFLLNFSMSEIPYDAYEKMCGHPQLFWNLPQAKLLVSFGFDWLQSHPSHVEAQRVFAELRHGMNRERTHIIQVEPRFSISAAKADEWIPIRPGAEGILALGVANQLILRDTYDKKFIQKTTRGFDEFRESVEPFTIDKVSKLTEVPEERIRLLSLKFLTLRPSAIIGNRGSLFDQMAVHSLNALLGNIGPEKPFFSVKMQRNLAAKPLAPSDISSEVLLIDRINPLFLAPRQWKPVLEKVPFIVTTSSFLTETAEFSDLVLPCHTPMEQTHCSFHTMMNGKIVLNVTSRALEPLYETKEPGEIFLLLHQAIRGKETTQEDFDSYFKARTNQLRAEKLLEEESEESWLEFPDPDQKSLSFLTRSGKFEFDELTKMAASLDTKIEDLRDENFPLKLYIFTPLSFSCGEGAHLPYLQSVAGPQTEEMWETWVEIHPHTAKSSGVADRDTAWIESRRGKIKVKVRVLKTAVPGVVSVPIGLGHTAYGRWAKGVGSNPKEITEDETITRVRIVRI